MADQGATGRADRGPRARDRRGSRGAQARRPAAAPTTEPGLPQNTPSGLADDRFRQLTEDAPVTAFIKDETGRYIYVNRHLLRTLGARFGSDWFGKTDAELWPPGIAERNRANDLIALSGVPLPVFAQVMPLEDGPHDFILMKFPLPTQDGRVVLGGVGIDLTQHLQTESERDRLAAAIEQAEESIEITDLEGLITYVNPAFERATGYSRDEVIGKNPRILNSGAQSKTFYDAMWAMLTKGLPWAADLVNRRKDGSEFTESALISPIRDPLGAIAGYVAVKHDVTHERALQRRSDQLIRERALIAATIRGVRAGDSPEETAQAICRQVVNLSGIVSAQIFIFELDGRALPIGFVVAGQADPPLRRIPLQRSRHLRERATEGPWIEPWVNRPWHPYNRLLTALGIHVAAYAPVRHHERLIGLLVVDSASSIGEAGLTETLPALVEFADLAGSHIGGVVSERTEVRRARHRISTIIDRQAFQPVFQPIVDLGDGTVVGYEALTRFDDGVAPDRRFAEADNVDLGLDLEATTLRAALSAAERLPRHAWLDVNVSPELILAGEPLLGILLHHGRRRVVLEVTEHKVVSDYGRFRASITALGPRVELAVDDAGAGFSSLRHILELRPAFVKLDRWLVENLESDEARQAMIVGVHHFARSTGCRIIAEGIETAAERDALRGLGIRLGQGYLLGRPTSADGGDRDPGEPAPSRPPGRAVRVTGSRSPRHGQRSGSPDPGT